MSQNKRSPFLSRCLAALALVIVYGVSLVGTSAAFLTAGTTTAEARGGGRGGGGRGRGGGWARGRGGGGWARGRGRGYGRGYGYGRGFGFVAPPVVRGCYWSRRYGRTICPY